MARILKASLFIMLGLTFGLAAASFQARDWMHAAGVMNLGGGKAAHPVSLRLGEKRYVVMSSLTWLEPGPSDLSASLENAVKGREVPAYRIFSWYPPRVDLRLHHWNGIDGEDTVHGMTPFGKTNLFVVLDSPGKPAVLNLVVTDLASRKRVLTMPIRFTGENGAHEGH